MFILTGTRRKLYRTFLYDMLGGLPPAGGVSRDRLSALIRCSRELALPVKAVEAEHCRYLKKLSGSLQPAEQQLLERMAADLQTVVQRLSTPAD